MSLDGIIIGLDSSRAGSRFDLHSVGYLNVAGAGRCSPACVFAMTLKMAGSLLGIVASPPASSPPIVSVIRPFRPGFVLLLITESEEEEEETKAGSGCTAERESERPPPSFSLTAYRTITT